MEAEFCLGLGGGKKVFYPPRPDYRRFKIPSSFTSAGHTHGHVCAPKAAELWEICYHLGNLGYHIYSQHKTRGILKVLSMAS